MTQTQIQSISLMDIQTPYTIVSNNSDKFTWEIPALRTPVREEIGTYNDDIEFKCLNLYEFPKPKFNPGVYTRINHLEDYNSFVPYESFDVTKLYTQTELKSNDFLNMLNTAQSYTIDAKSNCTVQVNI